MIKFTICILRVSGSPVIEPKGGYQTPLLCGGLFHHVRNTGVHPLVKENGDCYTYAVKKQKWTKIGFNFGRIHYGMSTVPLQDKWMLLLGGHAVRTTTLLSSDGDTGLESSFGI